ncbi:hypothetical protein M8J76_003787 [Diaphorina citri]|nr:hypothetical protein M8J76_003787 [Diaphorina citri]
MHFVKFSFALCLLVYCAVCTLGQTTKKPFLEDINENDPAAVEALRAGITKLIDGSEKKAEFYRNLTAVSAKRKELAGITMYIFGISKDPKSKTEDCSILVKYIPSSLPRYTVLEDTCQQYLTSSPGPKPKKFFLEDIDETNPEALAALRAGIIKIVDGSDRKADFFGNLVVVSVKRKVFSSSTMYIFSISDIPGNNGVRKEDCNILIKDSPSSTPRYTVLGESCSQRQSLRTQTANPKPKIVGA